MKKPKTLSFLIVFLLCTAGCAQTAVLPQAAVSQKKHSPMLVIQRTGGTRVFYREDGTLWRETDYKHGKKHGEAREYSSTGRLIVKMRYRKDQLSGITEEYYESGGLKSRTNYVNGQKDGKAYGFDERGNYLFVEEYFEGSLIKQ